MVKRLRFDGDGETATVGVPLGLLVGVPLGLRKSCTPGSTPTNERKA